MGLGDVTRDGVLRAIEEYDARGRETFLNRYGFGPSTGYTLFYQGRQYDSKAIVGVAHMLDRPSEGVLASDSFSGGKEGAAARLGELDFEVMERPWDPDYAREPRAWVIRAGGDGQAEKLALEEGCAVTGWSEVGELSAAMTREDLKAAIEAAYGDQNQAKLNSGAGRLFRFVNDVVEGDVVVLPLQTSVGRVAVGRVTGPYRYRAEFVDRDAVNTHPVDWFAPAVPREQFPEDLRSAFSQQGAISQLRQPDAANRLIAGAEGRSGAQGSWLFQANLKAWDLRGALDNLPTVQWVARQYRRQIKPGDTVHFWLSGAEGGVLGRGRILTAPHDEPQNLSDVVFELEGGFLEDEPRVWIAVERVLIQAIGRDQLIEHPVLRDLPIFKFANATNFALDPPFDLALAAVENERDGRDVSREKLFFITASGDLAAEHLRTSLQDGVPLEKFTALTGLRETLERHASDGRVFAWGARPGSAAEQKWERLALGDVCLVYAKGSFPLWGRVYAKARSSEVARSIWGEHNGEIWECMYFLDPVQRLGATREAVVAELGYKANFIPQGFEIPGDATQHRVLASHPTLMHFVNRLTVDAGPEDPRVWWVCQGKTYEAERDLGLIWAPKQGANGATREFWRALRDAAPGERILHYANGALRAVSVVLEPAVDAPQPEELGEQWERDGWLVRCEYAELDQPISLAEIPEQWRVAAGAPFTSAGGVRQGYFFPLASDFVALMAARFPQLDTVPRDDKPSEQVVMSYREPPFTDVLAEIRAAGLELDEQTVGRYHLSLKTRGFVVLSGISGSGKTWLAELYAKAVGAQALLVPVAPNWTANEDLLGYYDPLAKQYRHTTFSRFLQQAASAWSDAQRARLAAQPFHLILDEMNLARVEYYFAKFLSAMEVRAREGSARLELDEGVVTELTPNLMFIGTVNVDETTHGFADKVYDRAQLIEIPVTEAAIRQHLVGTSYAAPVLEVWKAMRPIAPFAHRILDEIAAYVVEAEKLGIDTSEGLDEQLVQKVLPKIGGTDPRIGEALGRFIELAEPVWPLSAAKAKAMQDMFASHGFTSYFEA